MTFEQLLVIKARDNREKKCYSGTYVEFEKKTQCTSRVGETYLMSLEIVLLFQNIVLYKQRTICLIFDNLVPKYTFTQYFTQISQNVKSGFHIFCKIVQSNSHVTEKFMKAQKSLILWILWKGSTMTDRLFKMRHTLILNTFHLLT